MKRRLQITPLATVKTRRQEWMATDLVPFQVSTILAGRAGIGKSTLLAWFTAQATRGTFEGDAKGQPVAVALISGEDDLSTTLVPRLRAAGADMKLVFDMSSVITGSDDGTSWATLPTLADDLAALREALIETGARLLIIDPVLSIMDGDAHKAAEVRRNLDPLAALARELNLAVVLVAHFTKGAQNASDALSGSHAFRDVARSVLLLAKDEESGNRVLTVDKSNYGSRMPSLAFAIDTVTVTTDDGRTSEVGQARLIGESDVSVHELVRRDRDDLLGDTSSEVLAYVNLNPDGVNVKSVCDELDLPTDKARTYLARLVTAGRVQRLGRGVYGPNVTTHDTPTSVTTVTTVTSTQPFDTHITLITDMRVCPGCNEPSSEANAGTGYLHPSCPEPGTVAA